MEQRLIDDLKFTIRKAGFPAAKIRKSAGRIVISEIPDTSAAAACSKIFGVAYASPGIRIPCSAEMIKDTIIQMAKDNIRDGHTFAIRCHRSAPSAVSTRDIEVDGGSRVLKALEGRSIRVRLNHPDHLISADLLEDCAYVYTTKFAGPGGFPISSMWRMLVLFDRGLLSLFASYVMMRRGCYVHPLIPPDLNALEENYAFVKKLRSLVTRERYNAFVMKLGKESYTSECIRLLSIDIARKKRFKGIIFADISGPLKACLRLSAKSREMGLPIFQPLMGFDRDDLKALCDVFDVSEQQLDSELKKATTTPNESKMQEEVNWDLEEVVV